MTIVNNRVELKETRKKLRNNTTSSEKKLWEYLKWSQFEWLKFRRQHSIERYIVDFYCPRLKLSIELDWENHNSQKEYDEIRTEHLKMYGIYEMRFTNQEIWSNIDNVLLSIKNYINNHL